MITISRAPIARNNWQRRQRAGVDGLGSKFLFHLLGWWEGEAFRRVLADSHVAAHLDALAAVQRLSSAVRLSGWAAKVVVGSGSVSGGDPADLTGQRQSPCGAGGCCWTRRQVRR